jgi:chromate reductase
MTLMKARTHMTTPVHILGISGSLRKASLNTALLREAAELAPEHTRLTIADISDLPLFDDDVLRAGPPEPVRRLKQQIAEADALLFGVAEYNYSISGVLKNAIDWASRPLDTTPLTGKPASMVGSGGRFGTVRAQGQLRMILSGLNMLVLPKPEFLLPFGGQKFDGQGRLIDEETREALRKQVAALVDWTRRLRGEQAG